MRQEDLARAMAEAVTAVPGVAGLHRGFGVEVATYFTGGKVTGIRLGGERVEVYVVAEGPDLKTIADDARAAAQRTLAAAGDRRPVDVVVADVAPAALERRHMAEAGATAPAPAGRHVGGRDASG